MQQNKLQVVFISISLFPLSSTVNSMKIHTQFFSDFLSIITIGEACGLCFSNDPINQLLQNDPIGHESPTKQSCSIVLEVPLNHLTGECAAALGYILQAGHVGIDFSLHLNLSFYQMLKLLSGNSRLLRECFQDNAKEEGRKDYFIFLPPYLISHCILRIFHVKSQKVGLCEDKCSPRFGY